VSDQPRPPRLQRVRGTQDIFGEDAARFERVVETFARVRRLYGFKPVITPVFEFTPVFARSLGETSDVVGKEMYSFEDRGGESLTLRPEFTAGIARAYISEGWKQHGVLKLAAWGPVFRYERPQKGRYRQFHQLDAEILGAAEPLADVEAIAFADQLLRELGIAAGVTLQLNTLGDAETRVRWREALVAHFSAHADSLSEDSRDRLQRNPMRILDSKAPQDRPIADAAPGIDQFLTVEAGRFFEAVTRGLDASGVAWTRNDRLVRGLDYYRHTAFEFVTDRLGAQGTVLAGGRYDGLVEALGGPSTPGIGWAAGVERLAMLLEAPEVERLFALVIADDGDAAQNAIRVSAILRGAGLAAQAATEGSMKRRFELATKLGVTCRVVVGPTLSGGLPERAGIPIRVNDPEATDRSRSENRRVVLNALRASFDVSELEPTADGFSPDAMLKPLA
jgi:histidyl-tRNA synthetase